jgi:hypothetical protein
VALVLFFPQIAMWFPNWLHERMKAERLREQGAVPMLVVQPAVRAGDVGSTR